MKSVKDSPEPDAPARAKTADIVDAVTSSNTLTAAAEKLAVNRRTLYRWLARWEVAEAVKAAGSAALTSAALRLAEHAAEAVDVLINEMRAAAPSRDKIAAAAAVLDRCDLSRKL